MMRRDQAGRFTPNPWHKPTRAQRRAVRRFLRCGRPSVLAYLTGATIVLTIATLSLHVR